MLGIQRTGILVGWGQGDGTQADFTDGQCLDCEKEHVEMNP